MKIRGVIYNKRSYVDPDKQNKINLLFIEVEEKININGDMIKIIPLISEKLSSLYVGQQIEVSGEVRFESIITSLGKRCFTPIPVIRTSV